MISVNWSAPCRRRHHRADAPLTVRVQYRTYRPRDWSLGGFSISEFAGKVTVGDVFPVRMLLKHQGFTLAFNHSVQVVWIDEGGSSFGAKFLELTERERDLLSSFPQPLVSGEVTDVKDVVKRLDRPAPQAPSLPKADQETGQRRTRARRILISGLYLSLGLPAVAYLLFTVYFHTFRIDVDSAVVSLASEPAIARDYGMLKQLYVAQGEQVKAGDALFQLEEVGLTRELEQARLNYATMRQSLRRRKRNSSTKPIECRSTSILLRTNCCQPKKE